jgi:predicted transcriptional regulator
MDVPHLIQQKLTELGLGQRDLADAAEVTESYISQLLSRKKRRPPQCGPTSMTNLGGS